MFNFNFLATKQEKVDITVKAKPKDLKEIQKAARTKSEEEYRNSLISDIKEKLFEQYDIKDPPYMTALTMYQNENDLLKAIISHMIDELEL
jgi:predicted Zn-dependent protease